MQLDKGYKGFSFSKEGPLDMRMDPGSAVTAKEIVNNYSEQQLGQIFREYGEDRLWRRAAKAIVQEREKNQIKTTTQLAKLLEQALGFNGRGRLHPATLVFQALRIAVNKELESIESALSKAIFFLAKGGRIGSIAFHSLEDRIVKNVFRTASHAPKRDKKISLLKLLTKKPLVPTQMEIKKNARARSAKMRFAERV